MKCIDVERRFPQFKIGYEDPQFESTQNPWHKVVLCRRGHICPAGGTKLWACTSGRTNAASKAMLSGEVPCEIQMDADDGINAEFDVADYQVFFKLMGAKKR